MVALGGVETKPANKRMGCIEVEVGITNEVSIGQGSGEAETSSKPNS